MEANDADLIIKTVDQRSRLAMRDRNDRKALQIVQEAFDYFSKKGGKSISQMQAQYDVVETQLERTKRELDREIAQLRGERDILKKDKSTLTEQQKVLLREKETAQQEKEVARQEKEIVQQEKQVIEQEMAVKQQEVASMSEAKAKAELVALSRKRTIEALKAKKELDSLALLQKDMALENAELAREQGKYLTYLLGAVSLFVLMLAALFYARFKANKKTAATLSKQNKLIEQERERSDELLHNIMPVQVAKELKEKGAATAQQFPEATVLFTDFKNFTTIAERLTPEKLVEELNTCFRAFDHIISQYPDIEKIKTIGDAYLCASGLVKHKTMPKNIVKAALEIQEFLEDHKLEKQKKGEPHFEARIGIHTGPLVAGVVGFKKFAYDIWGDTVNIAARMEETCDPGKVNISETTYGLVKYSFDCQPRGREMVKNKGMMEMYYVRRAM
jgi:class 3 adenylate cyclase